jgi:hypothetical protein
MIWLVVLALIAVFFAVWALKGLKTAAWVFVAATAKAMRQNGVLGGVPNTPLSESSNARFSRHPQEPLLIVPGSSAGRSQAAR